MKRTNRQRTQERHKLFAKYFIAYDNATQAAIKAGYGSRNAAVQGSKLLKNKYVQQVVEEERQKNNTTFELEREQVLNQWKALALADINDYYEVIYTLRYTSKSKTHERLLKYVGYEIDQKTHEELPIKHQLMYEGPQKRLRDLNTLTKSQRAAIAAITYDRYGNPILKLSDKEKSLEALSKILGVYEVDNMQKNMSVVIENRTLGDFYNDVPNVDTKNVKKLEVKKY